MVKLSSKDRKELSTEMYGLPTERKYPLTDKEHVLKAIQFFKFCPQPKQRVLANNINKRMKELQMTVTVSPDNPFNRYLPKGSLKESFLRDNDIDISYLKNTGYEDIHENLLELEKYIDTTVSSQMKRSLEELSLESFLELEKFIKGNITTRSNYTRDIRTESRFKYNPFKILNDIMEKVYDTLFEFISYNKGLDLSYTRLINELLKDLTTYLEKKIKEGDHNEVERTLEKIKDIMSVSPCNSYMVNRLVVEKISSARIETLFLMGQSESQNLRHKIDFCLFKLIDFVEDTTIYRPYFPVVEIEWGPDNMHLITVDNASNTITYLETLKNEIKDQLNIIYKIEHIDTSDWLNKSISEFQLSDIIEEDHRVILDILVTLERGIRPENIKYYNRRYTIDLDSTDLLAFNEVLPNTRLYASYNDKGGQVYYVVNKDQLFLLGKTNKRGQLIMIKIYDKDICINLRNLICSKDQFDYNDKLKTSVIDLVPKGLEGQSLTEGLSFDGEGGFKFSYKPKSTYMDDYAENHKILIQNIRSGNYEGVKTNLAFLFNLINTIERKYMYKEVKRVSEEKRQDALKARMFAMNDFKRYLRHVIANEPKFNFAEYYQNSDFGKVTVSMKKEDIQGVKKLLHTIMIS